MMRKCNIQEPNSQVEIRDIGLRETQSCNLELQKYQRKKAHETYMEQHQQWTSIQNEALEKLQNRVNETTKNQQNTSERCWLLLAILFTFCIPEKLKHHLSQRIQVIAGVAFFCCLGAGYIALYIFYGRAEEQVFLTITKLDNAAQCNQTLISNSGTYTFTHQQQWRGGDLDRRTLAIGEIHENINTFFQAWEVSFFQYKADANKFEEDMSALITNITQFVSTLNDPKKKYSQYGIEYNITFDNFVRLLFYSQYINGTSGIAVINSNFQPTVLADIFQDSVIGYKFNFSTIEDLSDNYNIFAAYTCGENCLQNFTITHSTYTNSRYGEISDIIKFENFQLDSFINTNQTKNILQYYTYFDPQNVSESDLQKISDKIIEDFKTVHLFIHFDLKQIFIFHYCYLIGVQNCLNFNQDFEFKDLILLRDIFPDNLLLISKFGMLDTSAYIVNKKWFALHMDYHVPFMLSQNGPLMFFAFDIIAIPFMYWGPYSDSFPESQNINNSLEFKQFNKVKVVLHFFAIGTPLLESIYDIELPKNLNLPNNSDDQEQFQSYIGSIVYNFELADNKYLEKFLNNSVFVENYYNNNTPPPFTLTSDVYSCKLLNTPSILERLANTHATGELISLALIILLIVIFILFILPKLSSQQPNIFEQLTDAVIELFTQITEA